MLYNEPNVFDFINPWNGKKMHGYFTFHRYWYNKRLAVKLRAKEADDSYGFYEPYCDVTVNLPSAELKSDNLVFLDVNNAPWLEQLMIDKGFGMPTGRFRSSGFCNYPEFLLNLKTMKHYGQESVNT